ncbi:hypothetical protein [Magnetospirillum sp. ME-1]|uniref:Nmad3 family putative nucleotide modification protein n=1 Tax=Magnetospirillum sp. ME-1 TaxID=1639348 RepID=UPI0011AEBA96|nr:hypothetical protein [Magnetospirillum sp. ME-1]
MKIILSRKGFDSANGGKPSAILPDGRLIPLPIPSKNDPARFDDVAINGVQIGQMVEELTAGKIQRGDRCHLDPDLDASADRRLGWRPNLGQIKSAQGHLANQKVGVNDLFLFFGWFRHVEQTPSGWKYVPGSPDLHVIFGWLRIGRIVRLGQGELPDPLEAFALHPHLHGRDHKSNTLYLASDRLDIDGVDACGGGLFPRISDALILTDRRQAKRTLWRLPLWMMPTEAREPMSYHASADRWSLHDDECTLQTVDKGQEFVLDCKNRPEAEAWVRNLFGLVGNRRINGGDCESGGVSDAMPRRCQTQTSLTSEVKVYRYVVKVDKGFSPNPYNKFCTLACCKPLIRKNARPGDWVIGFANSSRGNSRLIYAMQVGEVLSFDEYYKNNRFKGRIDNIYCEENGVLVQKQNDYHREKDYDRDVSGRNALIARDGFWWYFGNKAPDIISAIGNGDAATKDYRTEAIKRLLFKGQNCKVSGLLGNEIGILHGYLKKNWPNGGKIGEPFDVPIRPKCS